MGCCEIIDQISGFVKGKKKEEFEEVAISGK
jgi:hypothetical protein